MAVPAIAYIIGACITAVLLWFVTRSRGGADNSRDGERPRGAPQPRRQMDAPVPRRRRNIQDRIQATQEEERSGSEGEKEEEVNKNIGTKKLRKMQDKEHKKKMRLEAEREREEAKKRREEQEKLQKEEEEKKLAEEKLKEEEEQKKREEKERQEHEEYLKMKEMFAVEEEGQQELSTEEESKNLLAEFIDYIKTKKVVMLEDLASHFGMRTQDAIDRVQTLLKEETITGVIDDRGKFIYISLEELKSVAKFIRQRGRVSISELALASNKLIDFNTEEKIQLASVDQ